MSEQPRRERKVITVVFVDIVGFTERAEQLDPEDVEAMLEPYQELLRTELERLHGTVEKFIGDAVMAVFGAPVTHEDDPERAVRAALAIRDAVREAGRLDVRIAVHTGEAIVRIDARPEAGETIAAGDILNTASRLQSAAPVNGILVGEATYNSSRDAIEYVAVDAVEAKGKAVPIPAWEAIRALRPVGVREATLTSFVGRTHELTLLRETLGRVELEHSPQLVTLVGVPGIGKSRLVYELVQSHFHDDRPRTWRRGRCLPYGDGVSYWAIAEIVKAQARILESDEPELVETKLAQAVAGVIDDVEDAEWIRSRLAPLVGLESDGGMGSERREESFSAWRRFLEAVAGRQSLMVVVEDLHWADDGVLDFLDHLADWTTGVPLLILCTARPELFERRPGWGGGKLNALTLSLSPLGNDDAARLIASVLDRAVLPADTQVELLERAGGNPLYAEQFALLFRERGLEQIPLPENVHALIAARIDTLAPDEKTLLQDAAVIGRSFWSSALPAPNGPVRERLHALERKEFVRREPRSSVAGEHEYAFRHVLVRDVAYGQIPRADRARKHQLAAGWIESLGRTQDHAEFLAYHYSAALELLRATGGDTSDLAPRARVALRDAGDRALSLNSFAAATGFYSSALDLAAETDPERPLLLFRLGEARFNNDEPSDEILTEAIAGLVEAGNLEAAAEAEVILSHVAWARGLRDEAFDHLERATKIIDTLPPSRAKTRVLSERTRHFMLVTGDRGLRAVIRLTRADLEGALEDTARALELARQSEDLDPHVLWGALSVRSWILGEAGETSEARACLDEIIDDRRLPSSGRFYRAHPLALWVAFTEGRAAEFVAWLTHGTDRRSRWVEAAEAFAEGETVHAADLYGAMGHRPLEAFVRLRSARALAAEGRTTEAEVQLADALVFFRSVAATRFVREGDALHAQLAAAG